MGARILLWATAALFANIGGAQAISLLVDDFNRSDDAAVGGSWTEFDGGCLQSFIGSGALIMEQHGCPDGGDAQSTRVHVLGSQHESLVLSGTFSSSVGGPGGATMTSRVVVRSTGTDGNPGSGQNDSVPCGIERPGLNPPDCWQGDGYGFHFFTTLDETPGKWISIIDNGNELALVNFAFVNQVTYEWEMRIDALNHIELFVWNGGKPATPTLAFDNGGAPYVPLSSGAFWQIEVKNGNNSTGQSHEHQTVWDDFNVASLPEPRSSLLVGTALVLLLWSRRRRLLQRA